MIDLFGQIKVEAKSEDGDLELFLGEFKKGRINKKLLKKLSVDEINSLLEDGEISYTDWVDLINQKKVSFDEFVESMVDIVADNIDDIEEVDCVDKFYQTVVKNMGKQIGKVRSVYSTQPSENGGVYTEQFEVSGFNLGALEDFLNVEVIAELNIDFRTPFSSYITMRITVNGKSMFGEDGYIHIEVGKDGSFDLKKASIESL